MAGYIGSKAAVVSSGVERKKTYSITGSTTSLTGLNYTVGKVHVYQNGVRLLDGTDYTATNGTSITLTVAAQSGDNVVVVSQASFQLSEHYTSAEADAEFVTKTGDTMSGNLSLGDNDKAIFGAGSDASLHSDGTSGYARGFVLQNTSGNKDVLTFVDGGATSLYHNNSAKLATTSTGIDVTGTALNLDGGGSNPLLTLKNSATYYSTVSHDTFNVQNNGLKLSTQGTERMRIDSSGNVGIGTSSISSSDKLSVVGGKIRASQSITQSGNSLDNATYSGITINNSNDANGDLAGIAMYPTSQYTAAAGLFGVRESQTAAGLSFWTGSNTGAERMRLDSSGKVMIGTTTEGQGQADNLTISDSGHMGMTLRSTDSHECSIFFSDATSGAGEYAGAVQYSHSDNALIFSSNSVARMRINSSGDLLVAQTSTGDPGGANIVGAGIGTVGYISTSRNNAPAAYFNRKSTDGDLAVFRKNGSTVGTIGVVNGDHLVIAATYSTGTGLKFSNNLVKPVFDSGSDKDNAADFGSASARWDDLYATNGSIQTSDFNEKQDIASLTATEMLVGKRISALFKTFRWKDSVAEKGDNARTHTGVIAQDVQAAFTAEGLDAGDYALFISSTWFVDAEGNEVEESTEGATSKTRLGIRYPELLSFVAAYNEQRFASIEARLTALEA